MDQYDRRLSERIRAALGGILNDEIADPRLDHVVISEVQAHTDADVAKVFYRSVDPEIVSGRDEDGADELASADDVAAALDAAGGKIRHELAERLDLRRTPKLVFTPDPAGQTSERVEALIRELHASD